MHPNRNANNSIDWQQMQVKKIENGKRGGEKKKKKI